MHLESINAGSQEIVRRQVCSLYQKYFRDKRLQTDQKAALLHKMSCGLYNPDNLNRAANVNSRLGEYTDGEEEEKQNDPSHGARQDRQGKIELGLILEGPGLIHILGDDALEWMLFQVADQCSTVIACRVSPKQKALLVRMAKKYVYPKPVTLAIGDGANDVNMIQEAQVGIGISGNEGQQAVNNSDFAIAQFRYLEPLLLVHGRWNYRRVAKVVLYSFYKNMVLAECLFYFGFYCGWSGTSLYDQYLYAMYNFFLGLPIIAVGVFDRDISKERALGYADAYRTGRLNLDMNLYKICGWICIAVIHAVIVFWVSWALVSTGGVYNMHDLGIYGTVFFSVLVISMNFKVMFEHKSVVFCTCTNKSSQEEPFEEGDEEDGVIKEGICTMICSSFGWSLFFWIGSIIFYFVVTGGIYTNMLSSFPDFYGVGHYALKLPIHWLYVFLIPTATTVLEIGVKFWKLFGYPCWLKPNPLFILEELDSLRTKELSPTPTHNQLHSLND